MAHLAALQLQIFQAVLELPETTGNAIRQHIRQSLDATARPADIDRELDAMSNDDLLYFDGEEYLLEENGVWTVFRAFHEQRLPLTLLAPHHDDDDDYADLRELLRAWLGMDADLDKCASQVLAQKYSETPVAVQYLHLLPPYWQKVMLNILCLNDVLEGGHVLPVDAQMRDNGLQDTLSETLLAAWDADYALTQLKDKDLEDHWFGQLEFQSAEQSLFQSRYLWQQQDMDAQGFLPVYRTLLEIALLRVSDPQRSLELARQACQWARQQGYLGMISWLELLAADELPRQLQHARQWIKAYSASLQSKASSNPYSFFSSAEAERLFGEYFRRDAFPLKLQWLLEALLLQSALPEGFSEEWKLQPEYQQLLQLDAKSPVNSLVRAVAQALAGEEISHPILLMNVRSQQDAWQGWLERVHTLSVEEVPEPLQERLVWVVDLDHGLLSAKIQKQGKRSWSKGRQVRLDQLQSYPEQFGRMLEEQDYLILAQCGIRPQNYYERVRLTPALLMTLSRHPRVSTVEGVPLSLIPQTPLVSFLRAEQGLHCEVVPALLKNGLALERLGEGIWQFYILPEAADKLLRALVAAPGAIPEQAIPTLQEIIDRWQQQAWYSDHSQLRGNVRLIEWPSRPCFLLDWQSTGLALQLVTKPVADWPYPLPLAMGNAMVQSRNDHTHWYHRDLPREAQLRQEWIERLGLSKQEDNFWQLEGEEALALLQALQPVMEHEPELVQWRSGSQQARVIDMPDLRLSLGQQQDWFGIDGHVELDQQKVASLRLLLQQARQGYVTLDEGNVVLMSEQLRQYLTTLHSLVGDEQRFDQQIAYPLQQLLQSVGVQTDQHWQDITRSWLDEPELPTDLLEPLREYQRDGVRWMSHLCLHGFGACLADDMGLGKTLQALTLLRLRREAGPALVVAPKSVVPNWIQEAARFAPELDMIDLEQLEDRREGIVSAGPNQVVVLSYGLVSRLEEELAEISWATAVLDEAQQIKNANTQRARTLFQLQAESRIALSGTPVENNLLELWSLFAFINPGLLGSKASFVRKYSDASRDDEAMTRLRALVSPFILRRMKSQVLKELPSKTEITHRISLSEEEWAVYEAARQQTLEQIQTQSGLMATLTGLIRLRQICCHPGLIVDDYQGPCSKLDEAMNLLEEAFAGDHRVLVFSQFIGLLSRLRERLQQAGWRYSYLDGSCTSRARQAAVEEFKAGKTHLFLISLKAGGTGLNLTEADTVIHLDPWWNPAVEDQASDRAHRLGQTQPVTVYRLVTEKTIEEKIVALHHDKRDLADKVLSDQAVTSKLDGELLLSLLSS
ncbi:DEAD/DEAH box helicase [Pokkaliibacter plantistimulans]|uniref:ATP-dependent helicase n=1 Tax=Proteobacteria bacterium 228 TaxID=2083153 RepID=A0A2S5KQ35_9PROT|nr:DEAD/DEAH box helicase [Pokkaliibacter plantistimulans]PPC76822.1 ATP-dependent helicase [Pokkaliibacter plantistimulans]